MTRAALAAVSILIAAQAVAYTFPVQNQGGTFVRPHWHASALPVLMQVNDQLMSGLPPNVQAGSDPMAALSRALQHWPAVSSITFQQGTTSITDGGNDGVNVMTFADTPANRQALEMAGQPIAVTLTFFSNDELREADILFNPQAQFTTTLDTDADLDAMQLADIEGVATHELGHAIGLHHSGVESAAMWPIASVVDREPDPDDIAGARTLYPVPAPHGTISGSVTVDGQPAFGAQVVAINTHGVVAAAALTLPTGAYAIENLPPDTYTVYVEPFDGPQAATPGGCVLIGNLSGAGIYGGASLTTNFVTAFAGGSDTPTTFPLADGGAVSIDFHLTSGTATVNPISIGPATVEGGNVSASASTHELAITAGSDQWIAVAGPNLDKVAPTDISILGPDITVDSTNTAILNGTCNGAPFPFFVFKATIPAQAVAGGRAVFFKFGAQVSALTGGVRILTAATPPCVGDCGGDHVVTVDELLTMVNIALGNASVSDCLPGDANTDGQITVDEILTAVNNALNGCL